MRIRYVELQDREYWMNVDTHANQEGFTNRVLTKTGYVMLDDDCPVGVLWYCVLWDNLPLLNFLYVSEEHRRKGHAAEAMAQWEREMKSRGYRMLMTSTQVDESAQAFYRKLGYTDCGGLVFADTPFHQPMELFLRKVLT